MHADFELDDSGFVSPIRRGRPKGYSPKKAAQMGAEGTADGEDQTSLSVRKAKAALDKMEADAANAWLKYKIDSKEYLPRSAFREASATLQAELAQGLRSVPDTLERKFNLPPEVVQHVQEAIDAALNSVAQGLELFVERDEG